jgi:hypothetical protein
LSQASAHIVREASRTHRHELGGRVAGLLAGAWRVSDEAANRNLDLSEAELTDIVPLLCESGAGALAWWQIRNTRLANTAPGHALQEVYRRFRLSALIHEREIAYVLSLLRAQGIEPVLVKGWAIARLYPNAGLRPYGDIDLCIRPDQFGKACRVLKCLEDIKGHYVDLHCGFARIGQTRSQDAEVRRSRKFRINHDDMRVWDKTFNRSQLVPLNQNPAKVQRPMSNVLSLKPGLELSVRVLSDEDHLRLLSLHLLRSGARRPPWLCDVALLLESLNVSAREKKFDWDACLGHGLDRNVNRNLNWLATTIGLAHRLLGANVGEIENTTLAKQAGSLPRWLVPAVLRQWGGSRVQSPRSKVQSMFPVKRPWTLDLGPWTSLFNRFDNPVRSTAAVGGQFNNWPRLPYRVAELVTRIPEVPQQLQSLAEHFAARPVKLSRRVAAV